MTALGDLAWPSVPANRILALPLGSTEQHGPHLPLSTDADVAAALCAALASVRSDVVVAPLLPYGASGEHQDFPGTVSIGTEALTHVLVELGRSASATFPRLLVVSGHGGNLAAVRAALATLTAESRDVMAWFPRWDGDAHAGFVETSLQLHLDASRVSLEAAAAGAVEPLSELMPALRAGGVRAVSPNGVLGDPAGATAQGGRTIFDGLVADLVTAVAAWVSGP
ncbi:mycofactocin biosynthesis peptidyl-dipeptidase MftE [Jiangella rhizosphaerae]|uniref:Mycofactocin biosynthesis peptidyl-dipeptidase MftE n=1 Tax=Jiangella rhizosphaerae TaxID=2293569 RepID=A0A418KSM1_9ACTN|nr:mycofactocin biosynthesis peptidyl-dipeptidase MftE [Jiangella rhizosphaerae]RIQ28164.1 mycofactocin biosynthesis peptidyl-dipeptidase MftE [Jiangella rhizosphaerae]